MSRKHYERFHGTDPSKVIEGSFWVPGGVVLIGEGKTVGYGIIEPHSTKEGRYVHDFHDGVKVYRRARKNERPTKTFKTFPTDLMVLGFFLGMSFDSGEETEEVIGNRNKWLCTTSGGKKLVVVNQKTNAVEYLIYGGKMQVTDWIRR